ncbi:MAG: DUF4276 family protein [Pyrinomonadaceae bacterium]
MRIGIIVDGDAESQALKLLTRRIEIPEIVLLDPIYSNMQPKSTPAQIARSAKAQVSVLVNARKADAIIVLIDREDRSDCPPAFAKAIERAFKNLDCPNVKVAVKDKKFENWLVSDVTVFRHFAARYRVTGAFRNRVAPNKADSIRDAEELLNQICIKDQYHKRRDAAKITDAQAVLEIAKNSRSFRKFLNLIEHDKYLNQSKRP